MRLTVNINLTRLHALSTITELCSMKDFLEHGSSGHYKIDERYPLIKYYIHNFRLKD